MTLYLTVMRGMSAVHLLPLLVALMMVTLAALQMSSLADLVMVSTSCNQKTKSDGNLLYRGIELRPKLVRSGYFGR